MKRLLMFGMIVLQFAGCVLLHSGLMLSDVPRISKEELRSQIGSPDVTIIDVRTPEGWYESAWKIKGAVREDPREVETWAGKYPKDRRIVLYCS